jgi:hypothetical protein
MCKPTEDAVNDRPTYSRQGKQVTRTDDVRKIEERAQQRAGDKPELDREREPAGGAGTQMPLFRQRGDDRGPAEPERHAEQFGDRE